MTIEIDCTTPEKIDAFCKSLFGMKDSADPDMIIKAAQESGTAVETFWTVDFGDDCGIVDLECRTKLDAVNWAQDKFNETCNDGETQDIEAVEFYFDDQNEKKIILRENITLYSGDDGYGSIADQEHLTKANTGVI